MALRCWFLSLLVSRLLRSFLLSLCVCMCIISSGVPRVSRARGQSQFGRPHPARSWQHRCEESAGSKRTSKAESDTGAHIHLFLDPHENFTWLRRHRIDVRTRGVGSGSAGLQTHQWRIFRVFSEHLELKKKN